MAGRGTFYTPIKRNHMIAPFGVGALLLARNGVGVIVCGYEEWLRERPNDGRDGATWLERNQISDPHFARRLGVNRLIQPPAVGDDPDERNTWFVRVARFPLTEYCINPDCRRIAMRDRESVSPGLCAECEPPAGSRKRAWPTQQTPLVLACRGGHLSEIPWVEWVHDPDLHDADDGDAASTGSACAAPVLEYKVATDVTAPVVRCKTCGAGIDLGRLRNRGFGCPGERPWLPSATPESCGERASVLERTSTSLYYPEVRSALYLPHGPELDHRLMALLAEPAAKLFLDEYQPDQAPDARDLDRLVKLAARRGITTTQKDIARHVSATGRSGEDVPDSVVRARELAALLDSSSKTSSPTGLPSLTVEARPIDRYAPDLQTRIAAVSAVTRVAETRALVGFSRVEPKQITPGEGFRQLWGADLDATKERDWLLAHRVYGEGILLLLNPQAVHEWELDVQKARAWFADGCQTPTGFFDARYILAHTISHALLREAANECGYALPSLRERLYVVADEDGQPQTGVLIFTAEGDAYGTLGGLVELARPGRLEGLLRAALEKARWCGADPVCMNPPEGVELHTSPGCCHHCLLLPETCCENFNAALDRAALVGGRSLAGFGSL